MPAHGEFRLSITRALSDQLITSLEDLLPEPLTEASVLSLESKPGVYQLYLDGILVYVGKADARIPSRLIRHYRKLSGRANIDLADVTYTALFVFEDLQAVAPETLLIKKYGTLGLASWNFNGFGNNDPGQNRDQTVFGADHFDVLYPARLDWPCRTIAAGSYSAEELASALKAVLPYVFRYESGALLDTVTVPVSVGGATADELFQMLANALHQRDPEWRIVALPGYVIMYPKSGSYPSARKTY